MAVLAHLLCALGEDHVAAGLLEDDAEEGQQAGVDDKLDPVYPSPVKAALDSASDKGAQGDADHT